IKVNKSITGAASGKEDFDETFYFGLFTKEGDQYTLVANSVISANSTNGADFTALFENVELGTYYVAETDANGNITEAGETSGQYKLAEVTGQYSEAVLTNESTAPQAEVDIENKYEYFGKINVTKAVKLDGSAWTDFDGDFYAALFNDEALTDMAQGPEKIEVTNGTSATVTFDDLDRKTYYLAETDADGNVISTGSVIDDKELTGISGTGAIALTLLDGEESATITNDYTTIKGSLKVTKALGGESNSDAGSFWFMVYDEEEAAVTEDPLEITRNADGTYNEVTVSDLSLGQYKIVETDSEGDPLETDIVLFGMKLATITYDQQTATLTVAAKDKNITITNTFEKIKGKIK
ncbi:MAG TPA: hypothetical protein PLC13_07185, partial [Bacillota bacterium]|nr:hypothetical protein [Bacillota bacterium]